MTQHVLAEYLESGAYERHLRGLRRSYERQVEGMCDAVIRHFPAETCITQPQGGYVLWVELPEDIDTTALHGRAVAQGLALGLKPPNNAASRASARAGSTESAIDTGLRSRSQASGLESPVPRWSRPARTASSAAPRKPRCCAPRPPG